MLLRIHVISPAGVILAIIARLASAIDQGDGGLGGIQANSSSYDSMWLTCGNHTPCSSPVGTSFSHGEHYGHDGLLYLPLGGPTDTGNTCGVLNVPLFSGMELC